MIKYFVSVDQSRSLALTDEFRKRSLDYTMIGFQLDGNHKFMVTVDNDDEDALLVISLIVPLNYITKSQ